METPNAAPAVESAPAAPEVKIDAAAEAPVVESPKRKIKWGDAEKEVTFDEAVQLAQKAFGIEGKAREAATKAEQADKLMHLLQNDPKEFAKRAKAGGLDPNKLATEILYENIRINSLTPEQRELEEYKAREAEAAAAKQEAEKAEKQKTIDAKTQEWTASFEKQLETAMKSQGLPKTRLALAITAQYIDAGLKNKKEYTVEQVLPFVLRDLKNIHTETLGKLEGEDLLAYLGEDVANKVAKARVARYNKGQAAPITSVKPVQNTKDEILKLKGKKYWAELRRRKSEAGIDAFPGQQ